jgi:hypothetical protein
MNTGRTRLGSISKPLGLSPPYWTFGQWPARGSGLDGHALGEFSNASLPILLGAELRDSIALRHLRLPIPYFCSSIDSAAAR